MQLPNINWRFWLYWGHRKFLGHPFLWPWHGSGCLSPSHCRSVSSIPGQFMWDL